MNYYSKLTMLGEITICEEDEAIKSLFWTNCPIKESFEYKPFLSPVIKKAFNQLEEYFSGNRKTFNLLLNPDGTEFQLKVWNLLSEIPYGQTISYSNLAVKIGNKNACRAAGMACNANKIPIFIPCHRVISLNGKMGGYSFGLENKVKLLKIEGFTNYM